MEIIANELSINEYIFDSYEKMANFSCIYRELKKAGINTCRIATSDYQVICNSIYADSSKRNLLQLIYTFLQPPFEDNLTIQNNENNYFESTWKYKDESCLGLAMAYLTNQLSLSFDDEEWPGIIEITRDNTPVYVHNVSTAQDVSSHQKWLDSFKDIELIKSLIPAQEKELSLRDDHGKDVLTNFSERILKSPYVIGVINSLPFNSHERNFIKAVKEDGLIECVLTWTDEGFGIVIKTTGRNIRETKQIAELLRRQFGK